ncbi:hypothetical protein TTHERM_00561650 (macronuclear) [Tetrahymena thermophila SB210]|uniref:Uncharacterized protein n=1 Tax=Tetrahymena thermophila (strain SB210) TaxID=312017 RepID=I7M771_TETTS|nr:hypothetical protein TTHERM_00561650 [Tetrahymena thermophila SB210]EAR89973.3 hypothetical protein TTHERM_00561650 [Tetrahymena thermophila SB210]|eukprot:XP_001010218.3 hypothetical protein TTHERM_00561650 [Tetrahymena thermophila SB210]
MTDIKSILRDQIRLGKQQRKSLQIMEFRKSTFQESSALTQDMNLKSSQGQNLIKMETIDSVSSKNLDENQQIEIDKEKEKESENGEFIHKSQLAELLKDQIQTKCQKRHDLFQQMIEEERKQQGAIVIKFGNQLQIQPKFMKIRGSMCSTELWSTRQKKDLCYEYIINSQLEKGKAVKTSTLQSKIVILNGLNKNSPFELNQFIDSRKYKMPMSDRINGVSYFKPEKMINQADIYMQLQQDKQGIQVQKYSIADSIINQLNTRIPIDLKFRSKSGEPTYQRQTASSTNKLIQKNQVLGLKSPQIQSIQSEYSPTCSPLSQTRNQSTFSSQVQRVSEQQKTRKSLIKQNHAKQQSFSDQMRSKYKSLKLNKSLNSMQLSTQDMSGSLTILKRLNSNSQTEMQFPKADRITELQNGSSQSNFIEYLLSPKSQTLGFKATNTTEIYSNQDFDNKNQAGNTDLQVRDQVKYQIDNLINQCNKSLLDNHLFQSFNYKTMGLINNNNQIDKLIKIRTNWNTMQNNMLKRQKEKKSIYFNFEIKQRIQMIFIYLFIHFISFCKKQCVNLISNIKNQINLTLIKQKINQITNNKNILQILLQIYL